MFDVISKTGANKWLTAHARTLEEMVAALREGSPDRLAMRMTA